MQLEHSIEESDARLNLLHGKSRGSAHYAHHSNNNRQKRSTASVSRPLPSADSIRGFLGANRNCCRLCESQGICCFERYFLKDNIFYENQSDDPKVVDFTELETTVNRFRSINRSKSEEDFEIFAINEIKGCISGQNMSCNNKLNYSYNWQLELRGGTKPIGPFVVCRQVFLFVWGITDHHYKRIVNSLKESNDGFISASNIKSYTDHDRIYEDYSYDEINGIFAKNVVVSEGSNKCIGEFNLGTV